MKTQVVIVGAGPAGLLLGQLLFRQGIDTVVLERRSPEYVLGRIARGGTREHHSRAVGRGSFVAEPLRFGRLFLAGDAAHIVPPTGAKGLNLAASDVGYLSQALAEFYRERSEAALEAYSARALARVWKAERFSWWMTSLRHRFADQGEFNRKMQLAELEYLVDSPAAATTLAENYVGLRA